MLNGVHNAVIIHNPLAGRAREARSAHLDAARRILSGEGIETTIAATRARGEGAELARQAVRDGRQLVLVCGGDGTLNEVVNGLAGSQIPLAVLPAGTANILAKELRIPWDIPRAAAMAATGSLRRVALGLAIPEGGPPRHFLCVGGAGPDGRMVYAMNHALKLRTGILAYWLEGFRQLFAYRFPRFLVRANREEFTVTLAVVGRTKYYGGPFRITTRADLREDAFEVALLTTRSSLRYLSYLPALWLKALRGKRGVFFLKCDSLTCEPVDAGPIHAQADGEPIGRLPAEFRIVPDALTLVVPKTAC